MLHNTKNKITMRGALKLTLFGIWAAIASIGLTAGAAATNPGTELIEVDAELIIETEHLEELEDQNSSDIHNHNELPAKLINEIQEFNERNLLEHAVAEAIDDAATSLGSFSSSDLTEIESQTSNANGGIYVTFDSGVPSNVQTVVNAAIANIDSAINTNPNGPVEVLFSWESLGSQTLLGFGGPETLYQGSILPTNYTYPAGLVNTLLGVDQNGEYRPEVVITINSDLASTNRWYVSTNNNPGNNQIDLYSVVLHEALHGLGFSSSATDSGSGPALGNPETIYDSVVEHDGTRLLNKSNPSQYLESNDLHVRIGGGHSYKLYAPGTWQNGSSYSHFDETTYPTGTPGALMSPVFSSGSSARTLDAPILGVLQSIGWPLTTTHAEADVTLVTKNSNSATVYWNYDLGQSGSMPSTLQIRTLEGSSIVQQTNLAPDRGFVTISGLDSDTTYNLELRSIGSAQTGLSTASFKTDAAGSSSGNSQVLDVKNTALDGQIGRLYQAYFLRPPDDKGLDYWKRERVDGTSISLISEFFADGAEFTNRYGSLTNSQFVTLVYQNVLGRAPDGGFNYWVGLLNTGTSRGDVMLGFSDSAEFISKTKTVAPNGEQEGKILRIYEASFLRTPSDSALSYWLGQYSAGVSLATIGDSFTASPEFQSRYGSLSNSQFVSLVYDNVLGRSASNNEISYWAGLLNGGLTRGDMLTGFSEGFEFKYKTGIL